MSLIRKYNETEHFLLLWLRLYYFGSKISQDFAKQLDDKSVRTYFNTFSGKRIDVLTIRLPFSDIF